MEPKKLSEGVKRHIDAWELIGQRWEGDDFRLGDEEIKNIFYDRDNQRCNIIVSYFSDAYTIDEDLEQAVLLLECFGVDELNSTITPNQYINNMYYRDEGEWIGLGFDGAGLSLYCHHIRCSLLPWSQAILRLTNRTQDW